MQDVARKIFYRQFRQQKWQRKFSTSVLKKEYFIIKSSRPDIVVPNMRFLDKLWAESASFENHVAVECAETNKSFTYRQLKSNMAVYATSLHKKLGLKQGDVVAAMLPNCTEFPIVAFGTLQAGCALTSINPIYKEFEVAHQISLTDAKVVITIPFCYETVVKGLKAAKSNAKIVLIDTPNYPIPEGIIKFSELLSGDADYAFLDKIETKPEDIAFIPFSSGTTGLPKGVDITYKNILAAAETMQDEKTCFPQLAHGSFQDVVPCVLPFFHIYGLVITMIGHLAKGCKLITMPRFSAHLYFDILKNQKASLLYVVPPIAILLGKHPDVTEEHFKHVRNMISGAAPLGSSDIECILEKAKKTFPIGQGWGATETTSIGTTTMMGSTDIDYNASGTPMPSMEIKFVDPLNGDTVPIGSPGEMYIRGPVIMKGYHKNEKETKDSLTEDGFFKTGDLGYFKPGHGLYITDRIKELIKVKGMQVAPAELESILRAHSAVQDAAVIGVPHEFNGEAPKAFIILKKGVKISPEEIQTFVADKVAAFKKIEEVVFVEDIPKTSSGKILRRELKKMYA